MEKHRSARSIDPCHAAADGNVGYSQNHTSGHENSHDNIIDDRTIGGGTSPLIAPTKPTETPPTQSHQTHNGPKG